MIEFNDNIFNLKTNNTSYIFKINEFNHLEHLYYGSRIDEDNLKDCFLRRKFLGGNSLSYKDSYSLESVLLEHSSVLMGHPFDTMIDLIDQKGNRYFDFKYISHEIIENDIELTTLPNGYDANEYLIITLKADNLILKMHYGIFEDSDVISKFITLKNEDEGTITIRNLMSNQLDLNEDDYEIITFNGNWSKEFNKVIRSVSEGIFINSSNRGASSSISNPFVILKKKDANEDKGEAYSFNLIYSGNHYTSISKSHFKIIRVLSGINPNEFAYNLKNNETFESPVAILSYSDKGLNELSNHNHLFINNHLIRKNFKNYIRPIVYNSWEGSYFDFDETKLIKMGKAAKELGIELFVLDDGWFSERNDDTSSLGDYDINLKKLSKGLESLIKKINDLGLKFGLWVEPEMISIKSKLYESHPDYILGRLDQPIGRNQYLLDLTRVEVQDYIIENISNLLTKYNISYIKWDYNRNFSDTYSLNNFALEVPHKYILGLYRILKEITAKFPDILFEGCASGGNRTDLGILAYMPQIWLSDNSDALVRSNIQYNLSYGYPINMMSNHVSSYINHQTLRKASLDTKFNVASLGNLGYELNPLLLTKEEKQIIKKQIEFYKINRILLQKGRIYRHKNDNEVILEVSNEESSIILYFVKFNESNNNIKRLHFKGLNDEDIYNVKNLEANISIKSLGTLVNMVSPIDIKEDGVLIDIMDKFVKFEPDKVDVNLKGKTLKSIGLALPLNFDGTGFDNGSRLMVDFDSRLYIATKK